MSIRVDPRRLGHLKQLAAEAGLRPGDLVRQWVEERIDAERGGSPDSPTPGIAARIDELAARIAALEAAGATEDRARPSEDEAGAAPETPAEAPAIEIGSVGETAAERTAGEAPDEPAAPARRTRAKRVSAAPSERVALHDEMIAVIRERGPLTPGELATAVAGRGRYAPPRSGKAIDAAMVSQRVSHPTYRARFTRDGGRIGLAEVEGT